MLTDSLDAVAEAKQTLRREQVEQAADSVIQMRRFRMLHQLCDYESQIIKKIHQFQTDDPGDLLFNPFIDEIRHITNRSA
jgi:hypothetical protein